MILIFKEGRAYFGLQFKGTAHQGRDSTVTRGWGDWSHCLFIQEAQRDACWCSACLISFIQSRGILWNRVTRVYVESSHLNYPFSLTQNEYHPAACSLRFDIASLPFMISFDGATFPFKPLNLTPTLTSELSPRLPMLSTPAFNSRLQ